jgi:hypothetical protein
MKDKYLTEIAAQGHLKFFHKHKKEIKQEKFNWIFKKETR